MIKIFSVPINCREQLTVSESTSRSDWRKESLDSMAAAKENGYKLILSDAIVKSGIAIAIYTMEKCDHEDIS